MDENELIRPDTDLEEESSSEDIQNEDKLIEDLSTRQMKAALLMVTAPSMTDMQIAKSVGRSIHSIRKWKQDDNFKDYLEIQKRKFSDNVMEEHVKQTAMIKQKLFGEIVDRLDEPPKTDKEFTAALGEGYTQREKTMYQKRYLKYMEAKEIFKVWGQFDETVREDLSNERRLTQEEKIADRLRERYEEILIIRARRNQFREETGFDDFVNVHEEDAMKLFEQNRQSLSSEENVIDAEFEESAQQDHPEDILSQYSMEE